MVITNAAFFHKVCSLFLSDKLSESILTIIMDFIFLSSAVLFLSV